MWRVALVIGRFSLLQRRPDISGTLHRLCPYGYIHIGIGRGVGLKSAGYFGEKVGRREPVEVVVNPYHCYPIICQSLYINL